jgi:hypothetical protein
MGHNCRSVRDTALVIGQSDWVSGGVNAALLSISKGMGAALPDDFKRQGRKWIRESNGLRQEVGLRRLRRSYGTGGAAFRLFVVQGIKSRGVAGGDWYTGHHHWNVDGDADGATVDRLIDDVREELGHVVAYLDPLFSPDGYCASIAELGKPMLLLNAYVGLGRVGDVRTLTASPDFHPNEHQRRDGMLWDAAVVLDAYTLLGADPPTEWHQLAAQAVKLFRGRPPKRVRPRWEKVRAAVDSWSGSA